MLAPPVSVTSRRLRLGTARDVRRELAQTYRLFVQGQIDRAQANTRGFLLATLCRVIADSDLERRSRYLRRAMSDRLRRVEKLERERAAGEPELFAAVVRAAMRRGSVGAAIAELETQYGAPLKVGPGFLARVESTMERLRERAGRNGPHDRRATDHRAVICNLLWV